MENVKYFSGIADETSDKLLDGRDEQLSLFLLFAKTTRSISCGLFMFFFHLLSVIREELTDCIVTTSSQSGLGFYFSGVNDTKESTKAYRRVQARVCLLYPLAIYTHSCSHVLNLLVSGASKLISIRNAVSIVASGVQRSGDAQGDCLILCSLPNFSIKHW